MQINENLKSINSFWVTGSPRTGSMWASNIIREILAISGFSVKPKLPFQDNQDFIDLFYLEASNDEDVKNKYVYKVHDLLKTNLPRSKYIVNIRNPLEICASFYKFMKCELEIALQVAEKHSKVIRHYSKIDKEKLYLMRFENIISKPDSEIANLAQFIGVSLSDTHIRSINEKYSKKNVEKIIKNCERDIISKINKNEKLKKGEIVFTSKNKFRAFDINTGFQTGHISIKDSCKLGNIFTQSQIPKIKERLEKCSKELGYY